MSPEAMQNIEFKTFAADVWAMGVIYYTLLFYDFPFKGNTDRELSACIIH